MKKSPGHRKWPDHRVDEERVDRRMRIEVSGEVIADSEDVIVVHEDDHPDRYYFPRSDVRMENLEASDRSTECPFKGTGRYFDIHAAGRTIDDAAWSYEDPYEEHGEIRDRIAFHDEEMEEVELRSD